MRRFRRVVLLLTLSFVCVLIFRTCTYQPVVQPRPPAPETRVDGAAVARRLARALTFRTIADGDPLQTDPAPFEAFHAYLEETYPGVHGSLTRERVHDLSLLYTWQGTDPSLDGVLLMSHLDVVPVVPSTLDDWTHPPFSGAVADGYIWGRGALDVKSGVIGILEAAEMLVDGGFVPRRTLYFAFGHDEEVGGQAGARRIAETLASRVRRLEMVLDEGGAIVSGIVPGTDRAVATVGIAEKGYTSLLLTARSSEGHSSMPPPHTSIGVLARAIQRLEEEPFEARLDAALPFFDYVAPHMSLGPRLLFANAWVTRPLLIRALSGSPSTNAMLRTTTAVTMVDGGVADNVLPPEARAVVNFRILPGDTPEAVLAAVRAKVEDLGVTVTATAGSTFASSPSPVSPVDAPAFRLIRDTILAVAQDDTLVVAPYLVLGATDARFFAGLSDHVYRFLFNRLRSKEDLARLHGTNERVAVSDFAETVLFYRELMVGAQSL